MARGLPGVPGNRAMGIAALDPSCDLDAACSARCAMVSDTPPWASNQGAPHLFYGAHAQPVGASKPCAKIVSSTKHSDISDVLLLSDEPLELTDVEVRLIVQK